ncbi:MAG: PIN domain-containing protein [Candidatus Omnitrophica bacterium]|nr:PIN domain-containing protein [Candidatus Omnitrophota bacterium]
MHKLFIDINVILDVALAREPHLKSSQKILSHIERKKAIGYISAISCTTIYYLIQKESNPKRALSYTRDLLGLLSVVEVNKKTLERGFELEAKDLEDGIQMACAETCQANYIITRNPMDYKNSPIPVLSPAEYLATFTT